MTRLTSAELRAFKDKQDWNALWKAAIPWVKFAATSIRGEDREDMIQVGLLKVGRAIPKWDPNQGEFSTYVHKVARGEMLHFQRDTNRRAGMSRHLNDANNDDEAGGESALACPQPQPTYRDAVHTPEGFGDPTEELARQFAASTAEHFLSQLDSMTDLVLREMVGMPVFDEHEDPKTIKEVAAARGILRTTMSMRIAAAKKYIGAKKAAAYTEGTQSIYPPEGRQPWVTHQPADQRHPGFWDGLASAMGDTDAWRESTGTVWKDWAWKPTDFDIQNGARK